MIGGRFSAVIGFDNADDAAKASALIKKSGSTEKGGEQSPLCPSKDRHK